MTDTQKPQTAIINAQHSRAARARLAPVSPVRFTDHCAQNSKLLLSELLKCLHPATVPNFALQ